MASKRICLDCLSQEFDQLLTSSSDEDDSAISEDEEPCMIGAVSDDNDDDDDVLDQTSTITIESQQIFLDQAIRPGLIVTNLQGLVQRMLCSLLLKLVVGLNKVRSDKGFLLMLYEG